jgi:hypothetical protein
LKEWLDLQIKIQSRLQKELKNQHHLEKAIVSYSKAYSRDFKAMQKVDPSFLYRSMDRADFLFIGDFHSLSQSQKFLLRLLKNKEIRKPKVLAFEALDPRGEKALKRVLSRHQAPTEAQLKKILPIEDWGSSWQNYRDIFLECKKSKIEILGLAGKEDSLEMIDVGASKKIIELPSSSWIFFGEFHCARSQLPLKTLRLNKTKKIVVLQQNEDRLLRHHLSEISAHRSLFFRSKNSSPIELYCVLHTPSWVKWQSYLDRQIRKEENESFVSAYEQIHWSMEALWSFLKDPRYPQSKDLSDLVDFNVISSHDEDFHSSMASLSFSEKKEFLRSLEATRIAAFASQRKIFITEISVNSCAQAAAAYLYQTWSHQKILYGSVLQSILSETICFFLTKILNHSRKTKNLKTLKITNPALAKQLIQLKRVLLPFSKRADFLSSQKREWVSCGVSFGRILADQLFEAFLAGEFSKSRLNRFLTQAPESENETLERLFEIQALGKSFESNFKF